MCLSGVLAVFKCFFHTKNFYLGTKERTCDFGDLNVLGLMDAVISEVLSLGDSGIDRNVLNRIIEIAGSEVSQNIDKELQKRVQDSSVSICNFLECFDQLERIEIDEGYVESVSNDSDLIEYLK